MPTTTIDALAELRKRIADARTRKQLDTLKELRHRMIVARVEAVYRYELARLMRSAEDRIYLILATASPKNYQETGDQIDRILSGLEESLAKFMEAKLYEQASKSLQDSEDDTLLVMTPPQLRAITWLPIDNTGAIKPKPGPIPEKIKDDSLSLTEILLIASPLLVLAGDKLMSSKRSLREVIFGGAERATEIINTTVETNRPDVSDHWRRKMRYLLDKMKQAGNEAKNDIARATPPQRLIEDMRMKFERTRENLLTEIQHEGMRTSGEIQQITGNKLPVDVSAGYTLHSRFAPTTEPAHAARDGWKFYKDNRPGSNLPWEQRLIPPYRKNCLCFTIPILQDPGGPEYHAEFGVRLSGGKEIGIRDVGTWQTWFDAQSPGVQQKIIGKRRWMAAASKGLGHPKWENFVTPDGKHLSVRKLLAETPDEIARRIEKVNIIAKIQRQRYEQAWAEGFGRFDMNPFEEAAYRKRLDVFLKRALRKKSRS